MLGELLSAGIGAAAKLWGGSQSDKATAEANRQNIALQKEMADRNEALQREFATSGIQWKVQDAEKAGVHPLYALGANTTSFSPISMGATVQPLTGKGNAYAEMGQDVSRAIRATSSHEDRAYNDTMKSLNLRKASLENDLLASQIAKNTGAQVGPPMPTGPSKGNLVPEAKDFEERPRLLAGGLPWPTNPNTTNQEDFEKRYGDWADVVGPYIFYKDREYAYPSVQKRAAAAYSDWYSRVKNSFHNSHFVKEWKQWGQGRR